MDERKLLIKLPPTDGDSDSPVEITMSQALRLRARINAAIGGGRPIRRDVPRCPCGKSTLKCAQIRKFDCCRAAQAPEKVAEVESAGTSVAIDTVNGPKVLTYKNGFDPFAAARKYARIHGLKEPEL